MSIVFDDLVSYLSSTGWKPESEGPAGTVWRLPEHPQTLPVLEGLTPEVYEWDNTIERIANAIGKPREQVQSDIARLYVDVQEFRAADDIYIQGSIPVEAGFTLISTARALVRAAAATSRSHKVQINGNYGKAALRVAESARFGHTIDGSYIVPLLMPLGRPDIPLIDSRLEFEGEGVAHPFIEPEERRTTRTLAQALTAIQHGIVEPAREPRNSVIADLVAAGVSKEMVVAIERIVSEKSVAVFNVRFDWAGAFVPPPGRLESISVPSESAELLRMAASRMRPTNKSAIESLSGQIIDLEDDPETDGGRATIRTFRRGRQTRIDIPLTQVQTDLAHHWFGEHRHVAVAGIIRSAPGRTSWVENLSQFAPLDELVLFNESE